MLGYDHWVQRLKNKVRPPWFIIRALNHSKERFGCPICNYEGPFVDFHSFAGTRKHAVCPKCGSLERHRLQYLVVDIALKDANSLGMKMIHFAPEKFLRPIFWKRFGTYETADLYMRD